MRLYHQKQQRQKRFSCAVASAVCGVAGVLALAAALGGCALSVPIASFVHANAVPKDEDVTGSVPAAPLQRMLEPEDWRRAEAALSTALDPQGNGSQVNWDNPQSGVKGSFAPTGKAYPVDAKICRGFRTEVARKAGSAQMQGIACADRNGAWSITQLDPSAPDRNVKTASAR